MPVLSKEEAAAFREAMKPYRDEIERYWAGVFGDVWFEPPIDGQQPLPHSFALRRHDSADQTD